MKGYLLLHGFAGSPDDFGELPLQMKAEGGWVRCPVLAGHQGGRKPMRDATWENWVGSAESHLSELNRISSDITVIGFSMGALIAAMLSERHDCIKRLVLISPLVFPNPPELISGVAGAVKRRMRTNASSGSHLREYLRRFSQAPVRSINEIHQLLRVAKPVYSRINKPTLLIQGGKDDIAHPKGAQEIYNQIASQEKKLVILHQSRHIICTGPEQERVFQEITAFLSFMEPKE
ncbi:alpha/beta hydrolase [Desmospora activa]|nr:alpha/beta fold hydrolase [Desmospora activa]